MLKAIKTGWVSFNQMQRNRSTNKEKQLSAGGGGRQLSAHCQYIKAQEYMGSRHEIHMGKGDRHQ